MTLYFIGLDPGTKCGYAVLDADGNRIVSGRWDLSASRHSGGGMRFVRLENYFNELLAVYDGWHRDGQHRAQVAYEEVRRHLGTDAAHIYGGIVATVTRICEGQGLPYAGVPVGTVKKLATGRGNANKEAMVDAANARWWADSDGGVGSDDEADALFIADALRRGMQ